jgi:membrane-bound lytic murein transglycosylase B
MIGRRELATATFAATVFAANIFAIMAVLVCLGTKANAAQCGSGPAGFEAWKREFAEEARAKGMGATSIAG